MKVILKDGTYSSKELCKLCDYDYKNFDKRQSTLINKLSLGQKSLSGTELKMLNYDIQCANLYNKIVSLK